MVVESQAFEFLAQALLYPEATFEEKMRARGQALVESYPWAQQMVEALASEALEDLQIEHVRLFVNDYGGAKCLPYESVYAERQVLGEVAHEVAMLYAQWGVEVSAEMPDHGAVELAFAAHLARLQPVVDHDAGAAVVEAQSPRPQPGWALEAFEREHLRAWLPALGADLHRTAELSFYRTLGAALQAVFGARSGAGA